jgi:hypothetical protein
VTSKIIAPARIAVLGRADKALCEIKPVWDTAVGHEGPNPEDDILLPRLLL